MSTTDSDRRAQWLADRNTGIGASDSWKILLGQQFPVWAEKTGLAEPEDLSGNEAVEFGIRLERPILEAYAARTGRVCEPWPQHTIVRDPERHWLFCTPDATQEGEAGEGTVQIKTTSAYKSSDWVDGPPLKFQIQAQTELAVTGYTWGTLVVLIGGQRLRYWDFERNDAFIDAMIPKLAEFWELVQTRTPPPVDGTIATAKVLQRLHPNDSGETVALPKYATKWTREIEEAKAQIKELEERKRLAESKIKKSLKDATYGVLPDGSRWSWKTVTRRAHEVRESTSRVLRRMG